MPDVRLDGAGHIMEMKGAKKIQPLLMKRKTKTMLRCM
jgi:hypothetical protein